MGRRSGPDGALLGPLVVNLVAYLDLDEERDFDRDLQTELALAKKVTDDLCEVLKPATGSCEELCEALHDGFSLSIAVIAGIGRRPGQGGLHR